MVAKPFRLIVTGASGRMGSRVAALAGSDKRLRVAARVYREAARAKDAIMPADLPLALRAADAIVDFSSPEASLGFAQDAARARKPIVIGTTGWTPAQRARLRALSRKTAIFLAPNFSVGVAVLCRVAHEAARLLPGYRASIVETHHTRKKDKPSGTALRLAEALERGRIPIVSRRIGDVIGDHALTLAGPFERLELSHNARSRDLFAKGALEAAVWLRGRRPGLYGMDDLLGLR
jgi:4-hydroxy-tetrahydrodipicolinate reductase